MGRSPHRPRRLRAPLALDVDDRRLILLGWLEDVTAAVAQASGADPAWLALDSATRKEILDLARIASHTSGDRINAPLLCYALGIAVGRGTALADLGPAVREAAGEPTQ